VESFYSNMEEIPLQTETFDEKFMSLSIWISQVDKSLDKMFDLQQESQDDFVKDTQEVKVSKIYS